MISHNGQTRYGGIHVRQYRLILYITFELIIVCAMIVPLYAYKKLWYLVAIIGLGGIIILLNSILLIRSRNTSVCGHILILTTFLTITSANYLVWGVGTSYSLWFYVIPLFAASLVGWGGLFFYSTIALLMIIGFSTLSIPPFYHLAPHLLTIIGRTNHLFAYLIIVTTVVNLMHENKRYEQILHYKNHLLGVEKDKYQHLAYFDPLTNLPNRQYFKKHLQEVIDSLSTNDCVTVFFMDLDNLKYVNDYWGHDMGDHLLAQAAKRIHLCFRENDFVARLGGDEFTGIVLHSQDEMTPQEIAQRIIHAFEQPFTLKKVKYHSSISIGLSTCPNDTQTVVDLMIKADLAMYAAKEIKGSSCCKASQSIPDFN
ncbi:GGDEF domain-containing protein [Legionella maioricensis]|uniref:GGDEF domain-containing protein n=1 Tax=Legionella maioricensis TaxID=2896528 RepID=A0A9X2ICG8_9GAMM|nr:GGDEF domain-containing protein [Legionella maioricensis]MCL9683753.1 GGDEF domain-containing protein [Legionella maioricensis]MCL9687527.1 GGDEF domain-containing protein [Legionella maioricensis]